MDIQTCRAKAKLTSLCPLSHIDSARMYGNEAQVGEAVRESGIPRSQVYISGSSVLSSPLSTPPALLAHVQRRARKEL